MGKYLYYPLTVNHFLHIAIDRSQRALLPDKELGRLSRNHLCGKDDCQNGDKLKHRQNGRGNQHGNKYHNQRHHGGCALRDGLGNHLPQGINVTGIPAHNVAGGMGVKIADGKGLHMGKQFVPDGFLGALADPHHQEVHQKRRDHAHQINGSHNPKESDQRRKIGRSLPQHGGNIVIHQCTQGCGAGCLSNGAEHHTQSHNDQGSPVLSHIGQQSEHGPLRILRHAAIAAHFYGRHLIPSLLSSGIHRPRGRYRWFSAGHRACPAPQFCRHPAPGSGRTPARRQSAGQ